MAVYNDDKKMEKRRGYRNLFERIIDKAKDEKYYLKQHMIMLPQTVSFTRYFIGQIIFFDFKPSINSF